MRMSFLVVILSMCAAQIVLGQSTNSSNDFIAGYHLQLHCLLLGKSVQKPDGDLKDFDVLTPREIATIYHEMWHAWFIEVESKRRGPIFEMMQGKVNLLYVAYPKEKRIEIYEEAVADFIDAVVETYVQVRRHLAAKTAERREEIRSKTNYLQNTYGRLFSERYNGYYTKTIVASGGPLDVLTSGTRPNEAVEQQFQILDAEQVLGSFIKQAARFHLPVGYIREASKVIKGVIFIDLAGGAGTPPKADVVFAQVYLDQEDIECITHILFEGKLSKDPKVTFAEERFRGSHLSMGPQISNKDTDY